MNTVADEYGRFMNKNLGNLLPLYTVPLVYVSAILHRENLLQGLFVPILIIAFAVSILCATRKAFVAIFIILIGAIISRRSKYKGVNYFFILLFFVLLYLGIVYMLNNTVIGERFGYSFQQEVQYSFVGNKTVDNLLNIILGDRSVMYFFGLKLFLEHPLTGIGLCNYVPIMGRVNRIHSEYMVQLCENGIIGFSLLISLISVFFYKMVNMKHRRRTHGIVFAGFIALLVISLWAWIYCMNFAMIIYAIVLTTIYPMPCKKRIIIKNDAIEQ